MRDAAIHHQLDIVKRQYMNGTLSADKARRLDRFWRSQFNFKVSNSPHSGTRQDQRTPGTPDSHDKKEIA